GKAPNGLDFDLDQAAPPWRAVCYICIVLHDFARCIGPQNRQERSYSQFQMRELYAGTDASRRQRDLKTYDFACIFRDNPMPLDSLSAQQDLLVDGARQAPSSGRYFTTLNPATEQPVANVAEADVEDVDRAVRSSRAAFEGPWAQMRAAERGRLLLRLADV